MPKDADPLSAEQVAVIRRWIAGGASWPKGLRLKEARVADTNWWSLKPLVRPMIPKLLPADADWVRTPMDAFIATKLREVRLSPSPMADGRTLIRRLYFDLLGLPPTPREIKRFIDDVRPAAYERLVDRLLASPHYGQRWARHWLDVVHYGDTHGFDKDKLRPNAWPYRDYVIRAFNENKPYVRFVREQIAGDVLWPHTRDGVAATGLLAAGPFDWVGHIEVKNGTVEKKRVRNLDRDDMVRTVMQTFTSLTVGCARCHNHKFDPITQEDYYSLQAVFAAVDRAERAYEVAAETAARRAKLREQREILVKQQAEIRAAIANRDGPELARIDKLLAELNQRKPAAKRPEYGYHSRIERNQDVTKWVQVDLGKPTAIAEVVYVGCHDEFAGIGAGFGFPVRYRVEISDDPMFQQGVTPLADYTRADVTNPGLTPQVAAGRGRKARYVRVTATKLAHRRKDYIFALAELIVRSPDGKNAAAGKPVTALDSIEAPVRWRRSNLVDGVYFARGGKSGLAEISKLSVHRRDLIARATSESQRRDLVRIEQELRQTEAQLARLPKPGTVFAAATSFSGQGQFVPTAGKPRAVFLLHRGSVKDPRQPVGPGTLSCLAGLRSRFKLSPGHREGERRAALADWIVDRRNPLTWRSIVNRVWHYHFGRGLADSPSDFGRMGQPPTHPELLDYLAVWFRDEAGGSIKQLHRLIVTSSVYRQSSASRPLGDKLDAGNRFLWRQNRRRLEAEAIRDSVLAVAGKLDRRLHGPGYKPFGFKNDHSPHYKYHEHNPDDPASWRRTIYRFIVRSVPDPFMTTLDCADPSLVVAKRNETITALQALTLLNNKFMVRMAEHMAARLEQERPADIHGKIDWAFQLALGRAAETSELNTLEPLARRHGLASVCRVIFNLNEFVFVD